MTDHKTYNEETIKHLLERFMDGNTTLEEEQLLAQFFRQTHIVPSEWQPHKQMFAYFDSGMKPADLASEESEEKTTKRPTLPRQWIAAAAVAVLLVGACLALWLNRPAPERKQIADRQLPSNTLPQAKATDFKNHHGESNNTTTLTAFATDNRAKKLTKPKAKKKRKVTKQPATNSHEELQEPAKKQPDDEVMEAMIEEEYANRKIAIIQAALKQRGYEPVIEEEGYVTFQRETESVITKEQEPINI